MSAERLHRLSTGRLLSHSGTPAVILRVSVEASTFLTALTMAFTPARLTDHISLVP